MSVSNVNSLFNPKGDASQVSYPGQDPLQALEKDIAALQDALNAVRNFKTPGSIPQDLLAALAFDLRKVQGDMNAVKESAQEYAEGIGGTKSDYDVVYNYSLFSTLQTELSPFFADANSANAPTYTDLNNDIPYANGSGETTQYLTDIINFHTNPFQN